MGGAHACKACISARPVLPCAWLPCSFGALGQLEAKDKRGMLTAQNANTSIIYRNHESTYRYLGRGGTALWRLVACCGCHWIDNRRGRASCITGCFDSALIPAGVWSAGHRWPCWVVLGHAASWVVRAGTGTDSQRFTGAVSRQHTGAAHGPKKQQRCPTNDIATAEH